eukprot:GHUV01006277.1.p1 GENE.GHUV01006277.1~~GHUV01006277.1.p1  ORF type:complete len:605 (+),score=82.49 GHUV01006277.1:503-2317(+)
MVLGALFGATVVLLLKLQAAAGQGLDVDLAEYVGASSRLQSQQARWSADTASAAGLVQRWAQERRSSRPCTGPSPSASLCGASSVTTAETATLTVATSPAVFDTRNLTQNRGLYLAPEPRDQGDCNACVAYALAAASQSAAAAALQKNSTDIPFPSARQLFFCGPDPADCGSGWKLQTAVQVLDGTSKWAKDGLLVYDCMPMSDVSNELPTDDICKPSCNTKFPDGTFSYTKYKPLYEVWQIQQHLLTHGASVVTRMTLPKGFKDWFYSPSRRRAVYDGPQAANGSSQLGVAENHAVVIAGYNNIENWWLIWSSWGKAWADGGFAKVRYNQLGIADPGFTYGVIFKPKDPSPARNKFLPDVTLPKDCYWLEVRVTDYISRVASTAGSNLLIQQLLNTNIQRIDSLSALLQPGQRLMVCNVEADCPAQENCYSCQQSPGCVWCYESQGPEVKPHCQSAKQVCPRFVKSIKECPVDNIPELPQGQKYAVTCSNLSNCRECLRFTYQCKWCITGVDKPLCMSNGQCSSWYGYSPKECPRDGDPGATIGTASCADIHDCDWCLRYAGANPQCVWCSTTKKCMAAAASDSCEQGLFSDGPNQCPKAGAG